MSLVQICVFLFVGICIVNIPISSAWSGSNICSRTTLTIVNQLYCVYGTWMGCCRWAYRRKCVYKTVRYCCAGWRHNGNEICNIPICRTCRNGGTCIAPNKCACLSAYKGDLCQGLSCVSHIKPCFPGWCSNKNCKCADNFASSTCLTFDSDDYKPTIDGCRVTMTDFDRVKQMMMYQYSADASRGEKKEDIWSNQNGFNILDFTFDVDFDYISIRDSVIPYQPGYIRTFRLGVVKAEITMQLSKLPKNPGGNREVLPAETFTCKEISQNNPKHNSVQQCIIKDDSFNLRIDSGDRLKFTFTAESGGYRELVATEKPNSVIETNDYIGKNETKEMEFFFDFENPVHCSEAGSCSTNNAFNVDKDFTKHAITTRWSGWSDGTYGGGVVRYAWEIFKMAPERYSKHLEEPNPLQPIHIIELNHTGSNQHEYTYTPTEPGMYSMILEINDIANNSRYVRRLVLYDPSSEITLDPDDKLYASSAFKDTGYSWQSNNAPDGTAQVTLQWPNHFANKFHEQNYLLKNVRPYPAQLDDGGRRGKGYKKIENGFDDNEGDRQISEIKNHHGIVQFEIVHQVDSNGGKDLLTPPLAGWSNVTSSFENETIPLKTLGDGKTAKIWVRATDAIGNTKVDYTLVHFDSTKPEIQTPPEITNNVENGSFPFSSRMKVYGNDRHSGLYKVHWKLKMASNGFLKMDGNAFTKKRSDSECRATPCYQVPMGDRYFYDLTFDINHCWMRVPKDQQKTLVMTLELDFYNSALLYNTTYFNISNIQQLSGIEDYYPPRNIKITNSLETGVSLTWDHAPSCYDRKVILIVVAMPDGSTKTLRADKDAKRFDIVGLDPETAYNIQLFTEYDVGGQQVIRSNAQPYTVRTKEKGGLSGGAIAAIVIVLLLILILIGVGILLWRTGKLEGLLERRRSRKDTTDSRVMSNNLTTFVNSGPKKQNNYVAQNRMSRSYADDSIYYGQLELKESFQIARKHVSLEQEIKRGKFAVIYKALWYSDKEDPQVVVAKILKENATENDHQSMKAKIRFYSEEVGEHVNVLKFLGAVEDDQMGDFMLLEYCECGTLKDYLHSKKNQVSEEVQDKLFRFAFDVGKGMNHLASRQIVHRRLAARNILLTFTHCVKISGFGPMPNEEDSESLPIKWMAPECIEAKSTRNATTKSDVWSYGIVLWEIFSMGESPYPDVRGRDLLTSLKRGERMKKPEYSDSKMYEMMKKCWMEKESKRPAFPKITKDLESLFVSSGDDEYYYDSKNIYDNRK